VAKQITTWVDGWYCGAHRDPLTGQLHGHTWRVRAHFDATQRRDARVLKTTLEHILRGFDHAELAEETATAEGMASTLLHLLGGLPCVRVDVWREPEGMGASACA
jgi:hypothetical protein